MMTTCETGEPCQDSAGAGSISLPGVPASVPRLRKYVRDRLGSGHPAADAVELCASELATNALDHTASGTPGGRVTLGLTVDAALVRLAVTDEGPRTPAGGAGPVATAAEWDAERGRGLFLVAALADAWGVDGTTVWCEFPG